MPNLLNVAMIETILSLHARGWSGRRIARELGIDRETVSRQLRQAASSSKPANAPTGSAIDAGDSKPANAPTGSATVSDPSNSAFPNTAAEPSQSPPAQPEQPPRRASGCEPWREAIRCKIDLGLHSKRIHQDLVAEHGFTGSYYSVLRFVRRLAAKLELPFRRMECEAGEEAQIDFGGGAPILTPEKKRRRTHVLRIVLSHSRKAYSEVVYRQTTDDFIHCLENAFWHFGGVPRQLVLDNLRAAVTKADWFDPELNPRVRSFAAHYGVAMLPTRPYTPRHKGKVERGVDYVQENGLRGRTFASLEEQNQFLLNWEQTVADTRLHGTTRRQVGTHFATIERAALQPLPVERFPCFHEERRKVHRDGHVEIARAYYSVPPEFLARSVWARWDSRIVRIFDERMNPIAVHSRREPGRFSTQSQHIHSAKISGVERGAAWLLSKVRLIGRHSQGWAEFVIANRGVEGVRVLQGLLNLARRHPSDALERACDTALSYGADHLRVIRTLLQRPAPRQEPLPFLDAHPLIRNLSDYAQFVRDSFHKEGE
jgi:transposase